MHLANARANDLPTTAVPRATNDAPLFVDSNPPRETQHHTDPELLEQVQALCSEYNDMFQQPTSPAKAPPFKIQVKPNASLPYSTPRRMAPKVAQDIKNEVNDLLRLDILQNSTSAAASPVVPVKKPDGSYRPCADYRELIAVTVPIRHPTPSREATIQRLRGHECYFTLDLCKGFHQTPCAPTTVPLTAIALPWGLCECARMPFGPVNGTAVFQHAMDTVFSDYITDFMTIFVDDICGFSSTAAEHMSNSRKVFQPCRDTGLN